MLISRIRFGKSPIRICGIPSIPMASFSKIRLSLSVRLHQKLRDVIDNPISPEIKAPVMHLNVLAATMDHEFLRKLPVALDLVIVSVFGLLAWLLLRYVGRWLICLLLFLALSVAYLLLVFLLYNFLGIFVPIVPPLLTLVGCGFLGFVAQQFHKRSHSMVHG